MWIETVVCAHWKTWPAAELCQWLYDGSEADTARQRGRTRGRSERNCGSVDKVKLKWSYLCLNIRCVYHHNLHHFRIKTHFTTSLYSSSAHLSGFHLGNVDYLFFVYYLYYLYFILKHVLCHSFGSCHGKTKWWFIPAFPGPLQIVARPCFCFFFSSPFFWYHFFPAWHQRTCVASLSLWSSKFICVSISHCHNTKLLTIVRECLFNYDSYSSSLSLSV